VSGQSSNPGLSNDILTGEAIIVQFGCMLVQQCRNGVVFFRETPLQFRNIFFGNLQSRPAKPKKGVVVKKLFSLTPTVHTRSKSIRPYTLHAYHDIPNIRFEMPSIGYGEPVSPITPAQSLHPPLIHAEGFVKQDWLTVDWR
jgi:hypothetical protein